jgi:hypothetical protein
MPRFVRPSWVEVDADGRKARIGTGPIGIKPDNSNLFAEFKVRENGSIVPSVSVESAVVPDPAKPGKYKNKLQVFDPAGAVIFTHETEL